MTAATLASDSGSLEIPYTPRLKRDFLSTLAHDLRASLGNILGFAELLASETAHLLDEHQKHHLRRLLANGQHMQNVLDSTIVIEAARKTGKLPPVRREPMDLRATVERAIERNGYLALQKDIRVTARIPDAAVVVSSSPAMLDRVLENLLANALKFSPRGAQVEVGVRESAGRVTLSVVDAGPGIPAEEQGRLFRRYSRTTVQPSGAPASTGLGLYLVSRLVKRLGGIVKVLSAVGRGSTFEVELPQLSSDKR